MTKKNEPVVDWWSTRPTGRAENSEPVDPTPRPSVPESPPAFTAPPSSDPVREGSDEEAAKRARGMTLKVMSAVTGVVIVGALLFNASSGDSDAKERTPSAVTSAAPGGELPPADGQVPDGSLPAAGGGPKSPQQEETPNRRTERPGLQRVTLTVRPSGKGSVGAIVKILLRNDTGEPLTVMATLIRGDGKPGIVGEGTLAPGSRIVDPGQTVEGTVEFSTTTIPHQVALVDLSGNIVAASAEG